LNPDSAVEGKVTSKEQTFHSESGINLDAGLAGMTGWGVQIRKRVPEPTRMTNEIH
jgi:hypothetical protein